MLLPNPPAAPIPLCVALLVLIAAGTDITSRRIPNRLIAFALAAALFAQCAIGDWHTGAITWLEGAATGFGLLLPFYLARGMAAGDVKLMLAVGAWVGPALAAWIVLATFLAGGIAAIFLILWHKSHRALITNLRSIFVNAVAQTGMHRLTETPPIQSAGLMPYGIAIAAGTLVTLYVVAR